MSQYRGTNTSGTISFLVSSQLPSSSRLDQLQSLSVLSSTVFNGNYTSAKTSTVLIIFCCYNCSFQVFRVDFHKWIVHCQSLEWMCFFCCCCFVLFFKACEWQLMRLLMGKPSSLNAGAILMAKLCLQRCHSQFVHMNPQF